MFEFSQVALGNPDELLYLSLGKPLFASSDKEALAIRGAALPLIRIIHAC